MKHDILGKVGGKKKSQRLQRPKCHSKYSIASVTSLGLQIMLPKAWGLSLL
jgi:hypothetical protein